MWLDLLLISILKSAFRIKLSIFHCQLQFRIPNSDFRINYACAVTDCQQDKSTLGLKNPKVLQ